MRTPKTVVFLLNESTGHGYRFATIGTGTQAETIVAMVTKAYSTDVWETESFGPLYADGFTPEQHMGRLRADEAYTEAVPSPDGIRAVFGNKTFEVI